MHCFWVELFWLFVFLRPATLVNGRYVAGEIRYRLMTAVSSVVWRVVASQPALQFAAGFWQYFSIDAFYFGMISRKFDDHVVGIECVE